MATIQPRAPVQIFKEGGIEDKKENARMVWIWHSSETC